MKKTKLLILLGAAPTVKPGHKHLNQSKKKAQEKSDGLNLYTGEIQG